MTAGRLEAMKKAIVGLVMTVEEVEGSFKLNQHKSEADFAAIANALGQGDADARQISQLMREAKPQAFAEQQAFTDQSNKLERSAP
jgi:transcriptional regulator